MQRKDKYHYAFIIQRNTLARNEKGGSLHGTKKTATEPRKGESLA